MFWNHQHNSTRQQVLNTDTYLSLIIYDGLFSRCCNTLHQLLPLQLFLGDWLLFSRRQGLLGIHVQYIVANKECYQQPTHNQQNDQSWVKSSGFNILVRELLLNLIKQQNISLCHILANESELKEMVNTQDRMQQQQVYFIFKH